MSEVGPLVCSVKRPCATIDLPGESTGEGVWASDVAQYCAVMEFAFDVGGSETHGVLFEFDQTLGGVRITVDGTLVQKARHLFSFSTSRWYRFSVGTQEVHQVAIEQVRKR